MDRNLGSFSPELRRLVEETDRIERDELNANTPPRQLGTEFDDEVEPVLPRPDLEDIPSGNSSKSSVLSGTSFDYSPTMDDKTKELIRLLGTKEGKALLNKASVALSPNDFAPATGLSTPLKPRRPTNLEGIQASAVKQHNSTVAGLPRGIKHIEPEDVSLPNAPAVEVSPNS